MRSKRDARRYTRFVVVAATVAAAVGVGAIAARGGQPMVDSETSLAPDRVTSGLETLFSASFENTGGNTLTNAEILVTLPAGAAFAFADPAVCTAGAAAQDGTILVSCPRGQMRTGTRFDQQIVFKAPTVTSALPQTTTVKSRLIFNERDSDGNTGKQHVDTIFADAITSVHAVSRNLIGKCVSKSGETLSTAGIATSKDNLQITVATVPANASQACSPVVLEEKPAGSEPATCPTGVTCQTEVSTTASPPFSVTSPVHLTFLIDGALFKKAPDPATFVWYKNGIAVPNCAVGSTGATPDPCVESRGRHGSKGIALGVRWSGNDPSWQG